MNHLTCVLNQTLTNQACFCGTCISKSHQFGNEKKSLNEHILEQAFNNKYLKKVPSNLNINTCYLVMEQLNAILKDSFYLLNTIIPLSDKITPSMDVLNNNKPIIMNLTLCEKQLNLIKQVTPDQEVIQSMKKFLNYELYGNKNVERKPCYFTDIEDVLRYIEQCEQDLIKYTLCWQLLLSSYRGTPYIFHDNNIPNWSTVDLINDYLKTQKREELKLLRNPFKL